MPGVKRTIFLTMIVLLASNQAFAEHETVPGPWGDLKDHVAPFKLDDDSARITHYRRNTMRALSGHLRAIEAVLRYQAPAQSVLIAHAQGLKTLSTPLKQSFSAATPALEGKPGAREAIWQERDKFQLHLAGFAEATSRMAALPGYNDNTSADWREAFTRVRHECLACHQTFRSFAPRRP